MDCRIGCGACCIALSISSPIPGMPNGKAAGLRCIQLDFMNRCLLFGKPERPAICGRLKPEFAMCGGSREEAMGILAAMEIATS
jgi:uncharacterized protein